MPRNRIGQWIVRGMVVLLLMAIMQPPAMAEQKEFPRDWFFGNDQQRAKQDELVGKKAPSLNLTHWINGEVTAERAKGKILVVDFWATWCGPCIRSIPHNNEIFAKYAGKGVILIGACGSEDGQEEMPRIAKEKKIQYPVARDSTLQSAQAWRVMWWPTYAVVDRQGVVRALGLKPNHVDAVIEKLLKDPSASEEKPAEGNEKK